MYRAFNSMYHSNQLNAGKYTIHGFVWEMSWRIVSPHVTWRLDENSLRSLCDVPTSGVWCDQMRLEMRSDWMNFVDGFMERLEKHFRPLRIQVNNQKTPACLSCIMGIILPNYIGILISQYKDPYRPTNIMESRRVFFVAQVCPKKGIISKILFWG